jgi:hypothetical protein
LGKIPTWWEKFRHGGKNFDMVGKILTWWEKFLLGNGTWLEKFPHSLKKRQGGVYMKA